jgi:kynurenine formamidase
MMAPRRWIDISIPLRDGLLPWPGDPPLHLERVFDLSRGDICNCSMLSTSAHIGTHMDAPLHFLQDGRPVEGYLRTYNSRMALINEKTTQDSSPR